MLEKESLLERFMGRWEQYFPGQNLPIAYYYSNEEIESVREAESSENHCILCDLHAVMHGKDRVFDRNSIRCPGARRYLGFDEDFYNQKSVERFRFFLSCGIPGEVEGERYKQSPELVDRWLEENPLLIAPGKHIIFKRIDHLEADEKPLAVCFFARPDVLSGLFTLAGFDQSRLDSVITPFGSGCSTIVYYPMREIETGENRSVLGLFDVSARPCVEKAELTFTMPWTRFVKMIDYMDESFLTTASWGLVRGRMP